MNNDNIRQYQDNLCFYSLHPRIFIAYEIYSPENYSIVVWSQPIPEIEYPSQYLATFSNLEEAMIWAEIEMHASRNDIKYVKVDYTIMTTGTTS